MEALKSFLCMKRKDKTTVQPVYSRTTRKLLYDSHIQLVFEHFPTVYLAKTVARLSKYE